ncbi:hypothetical protein CFter6_5230 [Collimonas fungivorans]|uniref:Uncharacterized protein n=1 Tax=Collimonas fungivorans TaxID=158899 RepID=A0A127PJ70_9BURK|nr:hypothetical protein CFter6_5230 [Collimonas fungivorans]
MLRIAMFSNDVQCFAFFGIAQNLCRSLVAYSNQKSFYRITVLRYATCRCFLKYSD